MGTSINTNIAAYFAQANIQAASNSAQSSISRLSSGNAIVQASDNVAALATGTSLATQVSALRTAQTNATQGGSLLQVADGALAQIQNILQQQQSVALQAKSGSLTNTDRGFLNQQFQALSSEINVLATGTTFNGVNLIDGSIATGGSNNPLQDQSVDAATYTVTQSGFTNSLTGFTGAPTLSQPASANDPTYYGDLSKGSFTTALSGGAFGTATQYQITYTLNGVAYQGLLNMTTTAGAVTGGATVTLTATTNAATHTTLALTVGATGIGAANLSDAGTGGLTTVLKAYVASATALSPNASATITGGVASNGISATINAFNDPGQNDTALLGALKNGSFQVTGDSASGFSVSYALNGSTYQGTLSVAQLATVTSSGHTLVLDSGKGSIQLTLGTAAGAVGSDATTFQTALTAVVSGATAYATHRVASTLAKDANGVNIAGSAITSTATAGTLLDGFSGNNIKITSTQFSGSSLPPISSVTATGTGTSTVFSILVNGVTYSTQGTVAVNGASSLVGSTFDGSTGVLNFYKNGDKTTNPNEKITLDFAAAGITASAKIATTSDITAITEALNTQFGSGGSAGGLSFQLGTTAASNVTVNIASSKTSALYAGATLDISTQGGASTAATTVAAAIDTVTSLRAGVGALESQFNFASAAIQSGIQNQDAARGSLLDTDISTESTNFATQQVKLQAGISVLAQANQQLQALLKLIG